VISGRGRMKVFLTDIEWLACLGGEGKKKEGEVLPAEKKKICTDKPEEGVGA